MDNLIIRWIKRPILDSCLDFERLLCSRCHVSLSNDLVILTGCKTSLIVECVGGEENGK